MLTSPTSSVEGRREAPQRFGCLFLIGTGRPYICARLGEGAVRKFTWDPQKARSNLAAHKVGFDSVKTVFDDPNAQVRLDDEPIEEAGGSLA